MPLAPVDNKGTQLYYEDTGALEGISYTTLIIVHGTGIHGAFFRPMLSFAAQNNLRVVLVNRRDYPGSTPISDEELATIGKGSTPEAQSAFMTSRGLEIVEFLAWFVKSQGIPPISHADGNMEGGFAVVAWSSANATFLALFSHLDQVSSENRDLLEPYFRTYVFYDGPRWAIGYPHIEGFSRPFYTVKTEHERFEVFKSWISAYYQHPNIEARSLAGLTDKVFVKEKVATFSRMTPEEIDAVTSRTALFHSEPLVRTIDPDVFGAHMRKALFDKEMARVWPGTQVKLLQCSESLWETLDVLWELEALYDENRANGSSGRTMEFHMMTEANHCAQWDEPERLTRLLATII